MLKEELEIVNVFRRNLFLADSIRGLMKKTGNKSYGRVFDTAQYLIQEGVLNSQKFGMSTVCSLNLNNEKSISYLSFLESQDSKSKTNGRFREIRSAILDVLPLKYFTLLVSELRKGKSSYTDIAIIIDNDVDSTKILNIITNQLSVLHPRIQVHVLKVSEFTQMLLSKEHNFVKSLYSNRIIAYGSQNYYQIIKEAIDHGFKS